VINQLSYLGGPTLYDTCDYCDYHYHYSSHYLSHCFCSYCIMYYLLLPIGSMYGIYANIWGILMVNVTIYGIHGSYGLLLASFLSFLGSLTAVKKRWFSPPFLCARFGLDMSKNVTGTFHYAFPALTPSCLGPDWDLLGFTKEWDWDSSWKMLENVGKHENSETWWSCDLVLKWEFLPDLPTETRLKREVSGEKHINSILIA